MTGVFITSRPSLATLTEFQPYDRDCHINVAVIFSQAVTVTGASRLALTVVDNTRQASLSNRRAGTLSHGILWL